MLHYININFYVQGCNLNYRFKVFIMGKVLDNRSIRISCIYQLGNVAKALSVHLYFVTVRVPQ